MASILALLVLLFLAAPPLSQSGPPPESTQRPVQSEQMRNGVQHFERAFFELTPKKHDAEAAREFDLAIAAFESELAARPASATAHGYLGRIYSIRKDYKKAAAHFDRLCDLEPLNLDAYVKAALAYAEDGQFAEARSRLEEARAKTVDRNALAKLNEYLSKLDTVKR